MAKRTQDFKIIAAACVGFQAVEHNRKSLVQNRVIADDSRKLF
jgi:hypothetical protein